MAQPPGTVTALRELRDGRVAVAVDGEDWRTLPADAVVRAGLCVGMPLDRPLLRELARALRRRRALGIATRALARRDLTREELARRLERPGLGAAERAEALMTLDRAGFLDDGRFAASRAGSLAARGYGDAAIRADLERRGVEEATVNETLAALEPEAERAREFLRRRGARGPAAARRLAGRGFGEEAIESAAAPSVADDGTAE